MQGYAVLGRRKKGSRESLFEIYAYVNFSKTRHLRFKNPGELASKVEHSRLTQYLPRHVQYACQYWFGHFRHLNDPSREVAELIDYSKVLKFLQEDFLHWLEALSLLGKMPEAILMVTDLQSMFMVRGSPI